MGNPNDTGLLPRTLDVLFNSIGDYITDSKLKPVMHSLVQAYTDPKEENRSMLEQLGTFESPHIGTSNNDLWEGYQGSIQSDMTAIPIDDKFEYGIWVSFAEIYTERIYDLLVPPDKDKKRRSLSLKYEFRSGHKYIEGLKEIKVKTIEEAYAILRQGQRNRAVFSTLMNQTSSRSHSIFTIRIVRIPIYDDDYVIEDPTYAIVSKMSIVDLAGSERYRNTLNSGQRLKEAGNINKSLMVLGQCMETLRLNHLKSSMGAKCAIVPYRHSKLTELFKNSFEGDGKAVMIVNANPIETGFDENSHVMKFAAVAKDVGTWKRIHPKIDFNGLSNASKRRRTKPKEKSVITGSDDIITPMLDAMDMYHSSEEEDFNEMEEEEEEEPDDPFVDNLIAQWADLRDKWVDAETRCASMEAEIRQQVSKEMEVELKKMEALYMSRITSENKATEEEIRQRLDTTDSINDNQDSIFLKNLFERQESLSEELNQMRIRVQDNDITKHALLEKIANLEKDRSKNLSIIEQLMQDIKRRDQTIESLQHQQPDHINTQQEIKMEPMEQDSPSFTVSPKELIPQQSHRTTTHTSKIQSHTKKFDELLDLRKKLRRSVFKSDNYTSEADTIMAQVESFGGVTFDLVKETNMGKLLKLITQKQFKQDPYHLKKRANTLLKKYIQLSISTLSPLKYQPTSKRDSIITVSVDAGKEEDLISEMRDAMDSLQEENLRLKSRIKTMEINQRRLIEIFDKPVDTNHDPQFAKSSIENTNNTSSISTTSTDNTNENNDEQEDDEGLSTVLGSSVLSMEDDHESEQRRRKKRKLRVRQDKN
ncbi:unnamed protein product [Cunninghamella echinulata]